MNCGQRFSSRSCSRQSKLSAPVRRELAQVGVVGPLRPRLAGRRARPARARQPRRADRRARPPRCRSRMAPRAQPGTLRGVLLPPIVGPGLDVLFVGINPGLRSAEVGHNFARPGNRFYPALYAAGFTPRLLAPEEDVDAAGATASASPTSPRARPARRRAQPRGAARGRGGAGAAGRRASSRAWSRSRPHRLPHRVRRARRRRWACRRRAIGGRPVWILPNPSGLNAHYKPADFARLYGEARAYAAPRRRSRPATRLGLGLRRFCRRGQRDRARCAGRAGGPRARTGPP